MTHIRNHRWLALLACVALLALVFGCHGGNILAFLSGCWNGDVIELFTSAMVLAFTLMYANLYFPETDTNAVGTATAGHPAELTAEVDGAQICYVGTLVQTGNSATGTLVPAPDKPQTGYTMALDLKAESETKMTGTLTWTRDGEDFIGPCTFDKWVDH